MIILTCLPLIRRLILYRFVPILQDRKASYTMHLMLCYLEKIRQFREIHFFTFNNLFFFLVYT